MITFIPTLHGAGVRLWGTHDELYSFYETIEHYWNCMEEASDPIELQRDNLLASFCYDIRHAYQGMRTVAKKHPVEEFNGNEMLKHLTKEAKRLGCTIAELTYNYEEAPYDFVW